MKRLAVACASCRLVMIVGLAAVALATPLPAFAQPPSPLTPGSENAASVADLFWLVLGIAAVVFVLVEGLLIYAVVRYRRQYPDEVPDQVEGNTRLEVVWTVIPALIMVVLFALTLQNLRAQRNPPSDAVVIEVTGHQWYWEFKYPDTGITLTSQNNALYIPAGEAVQIEVRSADVIHSFWVPELGGKMDAIPGHTNTVWFEANPGTYAGQCAEYCGLEHYAMLFDVVAVPRTEYDAWMAGQIELASQFQPIGVDLTSPLPTGDLARGAVLYESLGCNACHTLDGSLVVGPSFLGLGQKAETRVPGLSAEQYLRESILKPCDYLVEGFTCLMPQNFGERLEAQDLSDLIAFLLEQ